MTIHSRSQIAAAVLLLLDAGFTVSRNGTSMTGSPRQAAPAAAPPPPVAAAPKAPAVGQASDGSKQYKCGECGQLGHNARHHTKGAAPVAPPVKPAAAAPKAAPKASAAPVLATPDLDGLDFNFDDEAPVKMPAPRQAAPAPKAAAAPKATPAPVPTPDPTEAQDIDVDGFLDELDSLLP